MQMHHSSRLHHDHLALITHKSRGESLDAKQGNKAKPVSCYTKSQIGFANLEAPELFLKTQHTTQHNFLKIDFDFCESGNIRKPIFQDQDI